MNSTDLLAKLSDSFWSDPLMTLAVAAALVALASTPIAFAVLGRTKWFEARRGRQMLRPAFASVVAAMMLVMGIPAIFLALVVKSQYFDEDRYEFDPNKTWSVLEQGRGFRSVQEADEAVKAEMQRLATIKKELVDNVKKLDEAMLKLRAVAGTSAPVAQAVPDVLQRLAGVRQSVGVDGPQQLMDFTAPPVELAGLAANVPPPAYATAPVAPPPPGAVAAPAPAASGLSTAEVQAELAAVPEPQRALAGMLPLSDLPAGWVVGKSGDRHLESFNAENLFEKIDGRAESFIQYDVRGMAYTYYHPADDEANEVQIYIFEMASPLKALGKFGSEKPDDVTPIEVGAAGYTSAGSTLFYADRYYTQIVSTRDDAKFSEFALELARRVARQQTPESPGATIAGKSSLAGPEAVFALLPEGPGRGAPKYVAQDVFGYSFLSDVFMADYEEEGATWQGFLRPYAGAPEAKAVFDRYLETARADGAEIKEVEAEGVDAMIVSSNIGLIDVVFLKGNAVGGVNGATEAGQAEAFARKFVQGLPSDVPAAVDDSAKKSPAGAGAGEGDAEG